MKPGGFRATSCAGTGLRPEVALGALLAAAVSSCAEPDGDAQVAVSWTLPSSGTCEIVGADTFRLIVEGGEAVETACDDDGITLTYDLGTELGLSGELLADGMPITERLAGGAFPVQPGGADVGFDFALEDFLKTVDYRFKAVFQNKLGDVDCTILDAQRVRLRRRADASEVEGAVVCGPDDVCTAIDGANPIAGPCRNRTEEQVIPGLDWGRYWLYVAGEGGTACYAREVEISVGLTLRTIEIVADLPCE